MYCKGLTRQDLEDYGIIDIRWDINTNNWAITRKWYKNNSKSKGTLYTLVVGEAITKHKYTKDKSYPKVSFSYKNRAVAIPLSRVIYVWFMGDIPDGYVVDHIDNNPYNTQLNNLRIMTIGENIRKRFMDNPNVKCFNQFKNTEY